MGGVSSLAPQIQNDLVQAMKARDETKLSVLRMLKSAMQLAQVEKGKGESLDDDEVLVLVRRLIKQRNEAAQMYAAGHAQDRAQQELDEAKILEAYLPKQLTDEELRGILQKVAAEIGASGPKDMGRMMGAAMKAVAGLADGNRVKEATSRYLQELS